jgi:hypothetical protein
MAPKQSIRKEINRERSKAIVNFFRKNSGIKKYPICNRIGYDSSNLAKVMKNENWVIPAEHLSDFERLLKAYGFEPYKPDADNVKK